MPGLVPGIQIPQPDGSVALDHRDEPGDDKKWRFPPFFRLGRSNRHADLRSDSAFPSRACRPHCPW
ncbi:hypothetical protein FZC33_12735 [Labrys sp. KNU-23]|nr:hypothetical protein FZC33_12735 [Labrys sp. KNU-23]